MEPESGFEPSPPPGMPSFIDRVTALAGELTRFAGWLASSESEANDVVQETLLRALRARPAVASNERALRGWLFQVARNVHVDLRRAQAARDRFIVLEGGREDLEDVESFAPAHANHAIERVDLERALHSLAEGTRVAIVLTDVWELDQNEVAAILGVPLGTVKSRVARGRARLAVMLTTNSDGEIAGEGRRR